MLQVTLQKETDLLVLKGDNLQPKTINVFH